MTSAPIYQTAIDDVRESPAGRFKFAPGKRVSRLPFLDASTGLRARVTYATALLAAAAVGGRLPTAQEEEILAKVAFWIRPTIIRETPEERAQRIKEGLGEDYSLRLMATEAWAKRCDDVAIAQLEAWDGDRPVLNWGKHWVSEDLLHHLPGAAQAFNEGWDDDPNPARTHWIQSVGGMHNRLHVDYSQVLWVVWDEDLESDAPVHQALSASPDFSIRDLPPFRMIAGMLAGAERALTDMFDRNAFASLLKPPSVVAAPALPVPVPIAGELACVSRFVASPHCRPTPAGTTRAISNIVLHTAECSETKTAAEGLGAFFAAPSTKVSAHFNVDNDSIVQSVKLNDVAWAAPPLNDHGVHIELAGFAKQTEAEWHDPFSSAQLGLCAILVSQLCAKLGIPIEFVDVAGLRSLKRGITTHVTVSDAFKQSDHRDPGEHFPLVEFLAMVRAAG